MKATFYQHNIGPVTEQARCLQLINAVYLVPLPLTCAFWFIHAILTGTKQLYDYIITFISGVLQCKSKLQKMLELVTEYLHGVSYLKAAWLLQGLCSGVKCCWSSDHRNSTRSPTAKLGWLQFRDRYCLMQQ